MKSFRNPKYLERYEDIVFDLEQALDIDPNDAHSQEEEVVKIVADNTEEAIPFDWYNSRLSVDFKVDKLADHAALTLTDHNGIVNGSNTFIKRLRITANGRQVYDCENANHCVNIKNLLEICLKYARSVGTNEFYFPDTTRHVDEIKYTKRQVTHRQNAAANANDPGLMLDDVNINYNKGFAAEKHYWGVCQSEL